MYKKAKFEYKVGTHTHLVILILLFAKQCLFLFNYYPHFSKETYIKRLIYQIIFLYRRILNLEKGLISADLDT